ncbi:Protein root UVB sensitive 1, chloroplastic [Quillaja saponaria]|uniref:Protein root UVB sensitive 1, chloroplastic n=1 Tax=Quillaja saponaria TaxID=32244 RepID=A0AAD7KKB7_QUISA|nr:Protein root UVB sensitive 1, chloroplastic [Quillaja saponaria]
MNGAKRSAEAVGCKNASVGERSALEGRTRAKQSGGRSGSENVGLSNANIGENPMPRKPKGSSRKVRPRRGKKGGRENAPSQGSSTRRYGAEVTHAILPGKARRPSTKGTCTRNRHRWVGREYLGGARQTLSKELGKNSPVTSEREGVPSSQRGVAVTRPGRLFTKNTGLRKVVRPCSVKIDMSVKMRTTCTWTERPYEASLFPGIGFGPFLRSLGGRRRRPPSGGGPSHQ